MQAGWTRGRWSSFLKENRFDFVIDATHPYAAVVTQNICRACAAAEVPCYRCLREESQLQAGNLIRVETTEQAVQRLNEMPGNILLTTGSKELAAYTKVSGFAERVYPRVLPLTNVVESCLKLGVPASHLIAMQGPFSEELNLAMIRQWNIACLVTKESGRAGGVDQKVSAAQKAGIAVLLIGRPQESEQSFPLEGLKAQLRDRWGICPQQEPKTSLPYFPLFVPLAGKRVQVFGAGKIAARRIRSLLGFGCTIEVIAPQLDESLEQDALQGRMVWHQRPWQPGDCAGRPCPCGDRRPCGQPADCEGVQAEGHFVQPVRLPGGLRFLFPRSGAGRGVDHRPLFQRGGPQKGKGCGGMAAGSHRPA